MITDAVLIDTGPIVALLRARDAHHEQCAQQAKRLSRPAFTCWPVVTEAAYLLRDNPSVVENLLESCDGSEFEILPLGDDDLAGLVQLMRRFPDQGFQLADLALMYLAQREQIHYVFTLDRRHFSVYRTLSGDSLSILPE